MKVQEIVIGAIVTKLIKEVANVYFEALEDDPKSNVYKGDIVLFLDTLKVSSIETTAESTDATGGWGNPKLTLLASFAA